MNFVVDAVVPADHPSFAGHFPGEPVVAGVVVLDKVREALLEWKPGEAIKSLSQVKFSAPLLPGECFSICLEEIGKNYRFRCEREGRLVAQGEFVLEFVL